MNENRRRPDLSVNVVNLDGQSKTGKSSTAMEVARRLSHDLGFTFPVNLLDSGALYRAVGIVCRERGILPEMLEQLEQMGSVSREMELACAAIAAELNIVTVGEEQVLVNNVDKTDVVRSKEGGAYANIVGGMMEVRMTLRLKQLAMRQHPLLIANGRDMSEIFGEPCLQIVLETDPKVKAERYVSQLRKKGENPDPEAVLQAIIKRDRDDCTREVGAFKVHPRATVINNTDLTLEDTADAIVKLYHKKFGTRPLHHGLRHHSTSAGTTVGNLRPRQPVI